ncbi:hypothetical protein ABPG74_022490 [Tetrahymena malaccensis]
MNQRILIFNILALITLVKACIDPNAYGSNCYCGAGYYGISNDNSQGGLSCTQCPSGSTSLNQTSNTDIIACNKCIDNNATYQFNSGNPICFCNVGYFGTASSFGSCILCPNGTSKPITTYVSSVSDCNQCIDANAFYNAKNQACFCNSGYYGPALSAKNCQKCPQGTSSAQATGITDITACILCLDNNAYNTAGNNPVCVCKTGYYGTALVAGSCIPCPVNITTDQQTNANIQRCIDKPVDQTGKSINQSQSVKENEDNLFLVIMIAFFFILILSILVALFVLIIKKYRSAIQIYKTDIQEIKKSQQETLNLIKTYQQEVTYLKQINTNQPVQINQNDIQIFQKNDFQDIEEQPLSQQTIQMINNCNDIQKNQNSEQDFQKAIAFEMQVSQ